MGSETRGTAAVHATFFTPAWDVTAEIGQDPSAAEGDEEKAARRLNVRAPIACT